MNRLLISLTALAFLVTAMLPQSASGQFVPPEDTDTGSDDTYVPPPPPPPTTTTTTTTTESETGDRPMSWSERQRLKEEEERQQKRQARQKAAAGGAATVKRPVDFSIGVGAGWLWRGRGSQLADAGSNPGVAASPGPGGGVWTDLITPNTASARIRVNESLALEPNVLLGIGNTRGKVEQPGDDTEDKWDGFGVILGMDLRYGVMHRAATSFVVIGGFNFGLNGIQVDPEGSDNITTALATTVNLQWGLGVDYFITPHFALSGDVTSPLLSLQSFSAENVNAEVIVRQSNLNAALNFVPAARLMFHVYY